MAGVVNIVFSSTDDRTENNAYNINFYSAENVATSGTSAPSVGTAIRRGDVACVTAVTGACYVGKASTTAVNAAGWYLGEGDSKDFAGLNPGDTIRVVEAS